MGANVSVVLEHQYRLKSILNTGKSGDILRILRMGYLSTHVYMFVQILTVECADLTESSALIFLIV